MDSRFSRIVENPEEIAEDSECMNFAKYHVTCLFFFNFHFLPKRTSMVK